MLRWPTAARGRKCCRPFTCCWSSRSRRVRPACSHAARGRRSRACRCSAWAAVLVQGWWLTASPVFSLVVPKAACLTDTTPENIRHLSFEAMLMITLTLSEFPRALRCLHRRRPAPLCPVGGGRWPAFSSASSAVVLKLGGEPLMRLVWKPLDIYWNDFALFRYHGNAGRVPQPGLAADPGLHPPRMGRARGRHPARALDAGLADLRRGAVPQRLEGGAGYRPADPALALRQLSSEARPAQG
ncbi:MAG: hypothetical protein WDO13_16775 [Verrucomicrobiota bacterium]